MQKLIVADVNPHEARVALLEDGKLVEVQLETRGQERLVGNIYKGRVANILPGMQAAFVDIGLNKNAFLYAGDILVDESDFYFPENSDGEEPSRPKLDVPNIRDILNQNQEIMVQVLKQPGGTKGARVTTHITLPGRLVVLMPTVNHVGVSRRIENEEERERLKEMVESIKPKGVGVIVRTVAEGCSAEHIENEIKFLYRLWEKIQQKADFLSSPRLIHAEETLLFRTVRDMFTEDVEQFIINDSDYFNKVQAVVNIVAPEMKGKVCFFESDQNIFDYYDIETKIEKALERKVWIKNGCYLVIDETEALTVIDVNTGKYIGEDNLQDTILNANIEAAQEIAKQLRLRDISGIIVIDFIDMDNAENKQKVVDALTEALRVDRVKTNVLGMTELGLVEMTRKKTRRKVSALTQTTCPTCGGSGRVYNLENMAMRVRREVLRTIQGQKQDAYIVEMSEELANYIASKNNINKPILPLFDDKRFYMKTIKNVHPEYIRVYAATDKNAMQGAQMFL
jgi:ribonuclease G